MYHWTSYGEADRFTMGFLRFCIVRNNYEVKWIMVHIAKLPSAI